MSFKRSSPLVLVSLGHSGDTSLLKILNQDKLDFSVEDVISLTNRSRDVINGPAGLYVGRIHINAAPAGVDIGAITTYATYVRLHADHEKMLDGMILEDERDIVSKALEEMFGEGLFADAAGPTPAYVNQ